jgi:hypothetical protein
MSAPLEGIQFYTSEEIKDPQSWVMVSYELGEELVKQGRAKKVMFEKTMLLGQEELEILCEESVRTGRKLDVICNKILKQMPARTEVLNVICSYMKINIAEIQAILNAARGS